MGEILQSGSARDDIQREIVKLAETISKIESNFNEIGRGVQKIDNQKVIRVNGKLKTYSPEWTKWHNEYTALVHESQLSANEVQSKIKSLLFIIGSYEEEDHQLLRTHLETYINDLQRFQNKAKPIETRFRRLTQGIKAFRLNLKEDVAQENLNKSEVEEIDWQIKELRDQLSRSISKEFSSDTLGSSSGSHSTSQLFLTSWKATKKRYLEELPSGPERKFLAVVGIAALAPRTALQYLSDLKSLGFSEEALKTREDRDSLKKALKGKQEQRITHIHKLRDLEIIGNIIENLDDTFNDTISRLDTVHGIWGALRIDAHTVQITLSSSSGLHSGNAEVRRLTITLFKQYYDTLCFALQIYTSEVAKAVAITEAEPKNIPTAGVPAVVSTNQDGISETSESGVSEDIRREIVKLAETISQTESNFSEIKRHVQNIDAMLIGELKAYSPEWTKLHDEYTALIQESQLGANKVQSKIKYLLDVIKAYGEDHQGLRTHLSIYIKDLQAFQDEATSVETRFLHLSQAVDTFRRNLKGGVGTHMDSTFKPKLDEIDVKIEGLQGQLSSASQMFMKSWEAMKQKTLAREDLRNDPENNFLAAAPNTASTYLGASLEFPIEDIRVQQPALKENLKNKQEERRALTHERHPFERVGENFEDFDDTMSRLYIVQGIWYALRVDVEMLQFKLESSLDLDSGSAEVRQVTISRFKNYYHTLWFALHHYTSEIATTTVARPEPKKIPRSVQNPRPSPNIFSRSVWISKYKR